VDEKGHAKRERDSSSTLGRVKTRWLEKKSSTLFTRAIKTQKRGRREIKIISPLKYPGFTLHRRRGLLKKGLEVVREKEPRWRERSSNCSKRGKRPALQ